MTVEIHKLNNGGTLAIDVIPHAESAAVFIAFGAGSRHETPDVNGVAHYLEHMAFQGTQKRTALDLARQMNRAAADHNASTSKDRTHYYMYGRKDNIFIMTDLLGDIICNPSWPAENFENQRGAIIEEIRGSNDDPNDRVGELAFMNSFPGQPYGAPVAGPVTNIQAMKMDTLTDFMKAHYHGGNLVVAVAGSVDPQKILDDLNASVGSLPSGQKSRYQPAIFSAGNIHEDRVLEHTYLDVFFNAYAVGDPRSDSAAMLAGILGGGVSSRLFQEVREKRGLVYGVGTGNYSTYDNGMMIVGASAPAEKLNQAIPVICDEIQKICDHGVTDEELGDERENILSQLAVKADSIKGRASAMMYGLLYRGRVETPQETMDRIRLVTRQSVQDAARDIFPGKNPVVAVVGPRTKDDPYDQFVQRLIL